MTRRAARRSTGLIGGAIAFATAVTLSMPVDASAPTTDDATILPGRVVVDSLSESSSDSQHGASITIDELEATAVTGPQPFGPTRGASVELDDEIRLCFGPGTPAVVQSAAERAALMWTNALDIDGPIIEVDIMWIPFRSNNSLGAAGPSSFVVHPELPRPAMRYPVALANELLDRDFAPRPTCDASRDGEVLLYLNSTAGGGALWHFGTDAPEGSQVDLASVVAHELAHGLGFTGSAELGRSGVLAWPDDGGAPFVYDSGVSTCLHRTDDCGSTDLEPLPVGSLDPLLGDDLWYAADGTSLQLHAPSSWDVGSSFSHLDEAAYPAASGISLMTPYFELGEQHASIDGATLAVLQHIGWSAATAPATTSMVAIEPLDAAIRVTFTAADLASGPPPTSHVVRIEQQVVRDGEPTFELAFEPLEIENDVITIGGLTNGALYRLVVQGKNDNGVGPIVITESFTPGGTTASSSSIELALSILADLGERTFSNAEVTSLATAIDRDGAAVAVHALLQDPEFADHASIVRLYLGFLDRLPEATGIEFWIDRRRGGTDLTTIATQFAEASSFELGATLSDQAFVRRVYETILDRPAELEGLAYWTGRLNDGMPRGRLLLEVSESIEHRSRNGARSEVIAAYITLADRVPTLDELTSGTQLVETGRGSEMVGRALAAR